MFIKLKKGAGKMNFVKMLVAVILVCSFLIGCGPNEEEVWKETHKAFAAFSESMDIGNRDRSIRKQTLSTTEDGRIVWNLLDITTTHKGRVIHVSRSYASAPMEEIAPGADGVRVGRDGQVQLVCGSGTNCAEKAYLTVWTRDKYEKGSKYNKALLKAAESLLQADPDGVSWADKAAFREKSDPALKDFYKYFSISAGKAYVESAPAMDMYIKSRPSQADKQMLSRFGRWMSDLLKCYQ